MLGLSDAFVQNSSSFIEYRLFYPLVALFPVAVAIKIATFKGVVEGMVCKEKLNATIVGLQQCLDLNEIECKKIAKRQLCMLAREKMDTYLLSKMTKDNLDDFIKIKGLNHYLDAKKMGKPIILYTSHFGRMIMPAQALGILGHETSFLTTSLQQGSKYLTGYVNKKIKLMRSIMKGTFVTTEQSPRILYKILARKETLIVVADVVPQQGQSFYEDSFLGGQVRFPKGIVKLAKKMDAILVPYFALEHDGHLSAEFLPTINTQGLDEETVFQLLIKPIEEKIMKYPEQWWLWSMMSHFWRKGEGNA
jgi:KDO2-lipid IV(A) lauroyltransferase